MKSFSLKKIFTLCFFLFFIGACATPPVAVSKNNTASVNDSVVKRIPIFRSTSSDIEYLRHGISLIAGSADLQPDYANAKYSFELLLKEYPDSKWKESATALIKIINDLQSCIEKEKAARILYGKNQEEKAGLLQENEKLTKTNSMLNEKMQSEISKLVQENERLKKDIELLKDLEIKLDKRERLLR